MTMFNVNGNIMIINKDKHQLRTSKAELRGGKVMLCVSWDHRSMIHFEV